MTIREAIEQVDGLKCNTYTDTEKVAWLSRLDERVDVLVHGTQVTGSSWYDSNTDMDCQLLIPSPFDEIYLHWLSAQIDYANGEYDKYNAAITLYNTAYGAYSDWYIRTHRDQGNRQWRM